MSCSCYKEARTPVLMGSGSKFLTHCDAVLVELFDFDVSQPVRNRGSTKVVVRFAPAPWFSGSPLEKPV
eukprot:3784996-Prorocentrum_lima.AAC.1